MVCTLFALHISLYTGHTVYMLEINGMPFERVEGVSYLYDYYQIALQIQEDPKLEVDIYRELVKKDLWFIVYFILKIPTANHPFVVQAANEVQMGPRSNTLDVWAREHYKSSIITVAETIQDLAKNPEDCICILSYSAPAARSFLISIKQVLESSEFLHRCFPDVFYANPKAEAFKWSEEGGLYVKRKSSRKEASVEAWGLIDGQPTGKHFTKLVYDDVVTDVVANSVEMMEKVKDKFDMSNNLGTDGGRRRVIGTFYHHDDPLVYIRELKDVVTQGPLFTERLKPATHNGEPNGYPVLLSDDRFAQLRAGDPYIFNCQQLCNPTPLSEIPLSPEFLIEVEPEEVPKRLFKFMTVDPAGMQTEHKKRGDAWALMVVGVVPYRDDIGASELYIIDLMIEKMNEVEAMNNITRMYTRNGRILRLGVEKVGMSSMEVHVRNALQAKGIHLSLEAENLVLLQPGGRVKQTRIERNVAWPLMNGKIKISKAIPAHYRQRLKLEMERFPHWHDDGLDTLAYHYDIMRDYVFGPEPPSDVDEEDVLDRWELRYQNRARQLTQDRGWIVV